ncbi:hypothetical protein ABFW00_05995 [Mycobacteroides abscessus]|uniref:hypothetical protein n=1 Tax=Mycobacteroides abscessus TaxID=36809 RepID=UPI00092B8956|nr:hypothetical protein [Mycobacteroides abscessus]SHS51924.1 Uncharacterised protein [Mycobacteroides abscessus subsp. abscessus]
MSTNALISLLKWGGILNLIASPVFAVFFHWWDLKHGSVAGDGFPIWIYSFFYCTFVLGLLYIQASRDPQRYRPFIGVAIVAKLWGIGACIYAVVAEYYWLLVALYDVGFGIAFYLLYRRLGDSVSASQALPK